ncbi:MAG: phosphoglycerate kinase [Phycisphaerales bacterium]|nr:phosphoglycerate kinase [Phycisphaerales bacterium]NNM24630.1 phosphoglycerate kinase [Phycisphaerales bacterium]
MPKTTSARPLRIDAVDVAGLRVLTRVDYNVPLDGDGVITDDRRIDASLPTVRSVIDRGGRLVLMSHLGRPAGTGREPRLSLRPAAMRLGEMLPGVDVRFVDDCVGPAVEAAVAALPSGAVLVLENLRFHAGEKQGDETFARGLARLGDVYCNDAFGTAHRAHASMLAVPTLMSGASHACGFLLDTELRYLAEAIDDAQTPFVAVLGGAKVSDKLGAIANLRDRVDSILVGGAMAYTFLRARGDGVGSSRIEPDMLETAAELLAGDGAGIVLPVDHVCGQSLAPGTPIKVTEGEIPAGWMGLDIGPATAARFAAAVRDARTVIWNGPMGVFEVPPFDAGTRIVAAGLAAATAAGATTIVGGGDSAAAIEAFGLEDQVSHVSTGGGASLRVLEGRTLPALDALDRAP